MLDEAILPGCCRRCCRGRVAMPWEKASQFVDRERRRKLFPLSRIHFFWMNFKIRAIIDGLTSGKTWPARQSVRPGFERRKIQFYKLLSLWMTATTTTSADRPDRPHVPPWYCIKLYSSFSLLQNTTAGTWRTRTSKNAADFVKIAPTKFIPSNLDLETSSTIPVLTIAET